VSVTGGTKGMTYYKVELLNLLKAGDSVTVVVEYSLTEYLTPFPAEITQAENQFMLYKGYANVISAYPLTTETSTFRVGSGKLVSHTTVNPTKAAGEKITYGPFTNTAAFTKNPISIHYENNSPFVVATEVLRTIEVSHWGNIAVEENIELVHKGAKLKGSFSRLDFQMDRRGSKQPVVRSFKTILPGRASDIYYRDQIGNISTSIVNTKTDKVEVELRPRFPLFGGWRTNYVLGYNIPTAEFLFSSGSEYALKVRLVDHIFDNVVIDKLRVKIILPETSKNIKMVAPYAVKRLPDEVHKTYLDTVGRPVIVLEKENVIANHIQQFTLYYEFEHVYLLREPLIVVVFVFILFLAVIFFVRLDFSILPETATEVRPHAKKE
jgi:oligosaccharyltransferase complex subunit alpha (ribophorin I)